MNTIYEPSGRAREYSPLALNVYNGCDHGCSYCFNRRGVLAGNFSDEPRPRAGLLKALERFFERKTVTAQVLLCFTGDPYCWAELEHRLTRSVLLIAVYFACAAEILEPSEVKP